MSARRRVEDHFEDEAYEIVVAAAPFGPPLTSAEQMLRGGLGFLFFSLVALESWLLWRVWSLWG